MLAGGLEQRPSLETLLLQAQTLATEQPSIDGIPLEWDFGLSNHFLSLYQAKPLVESRLLPYAFVVHGAGSELRGQSAWGDGLYWHQSESLQRRSELLQTPLGPLRVLTGADARDYYAFYQRADAFAKKRRILIARRLFEGFELYSNETHQGLVNMNDLVLGTYVVPEDEETIFPLTLQANLPAFLVKGRRGLSKAVVERLGLADRARRLRLRERLTSANILPHGGGYTFPHVHDVTSVIELGDARYFELSFSSGDGRQIVRDVRDLPFAYRGIEVLDRVAELGLGELVARLDPMYTLKV
jgi:hypothetical protein